MLAVGLLRNRFIGSLSAPQDPSLAWMKSPTATVRGVFFMVLRSSARWMAFVSCASSTELNRTWMDGPIARYKVKQVVRIGHRCSVRVAQQLRISSGHARIRVIVFRFRVVVDSQVQPALGNVRDQAAGASPEPQIST
ncbi:putative helicase [Pseudomonas phage PIP]|nr:putative helicase [Pseudomonas phage PIP]